MARVEKSIFFIFLSKDTFQVDKNPDVDCSRKEHFICKKN